MRWLVEVTALGKSDKESLFLEAESWQKALQGARSQRGDNAPMSGFSIELLDDGCRAVDPVSRVRYDIRKAADEAPVARSQPQPPRPASHAPPASAATSASEPAIPAAPRVPSPSARPQPAAAPARTMGGPGGGAYLQDAAPQIQALPHPSPMAGMPMPTGVPAHVRSDVAVSVASQVIFKREQDPSDAMPLAYREYVYLVPHGTSEAVAETLVSTQLELIRSSLDRLPPGKLVNLGVFDVAFQGKPPVAPLVTLSWKDWRGSPVVAFPRRAPVAPSQAHQPALPALPALPPQVPQVHAPQPVMTPQPPAALAPGPVPPPPASVSPSAPPAPGFPPQTYAVPPSVQPFAPPVVAPTFEAPSPVPTVPPAAPLAAAPPAPPAPLAPPAFIVPPAPAVRPPSGSGRAATPGSRVRGEDLIADLFEAMHDLHFVRDAIEAGEFCLTLAMEKLPSQAGIVHQYDIDRREFLVTSTRGNGTSKLLLRRHPENDILLHAAMARRRAIVIPDATVGEGGALDRFTLIGGARSLMIAPVMQHGRFLGAIELLNPLDGQPFTDTEGNALNYIAEQFAEFLAAHGIVTDPERISGRQLPGT